MLSILVPVPLLANGQVILNMLNFSKQTAQTEVLILKFGLLNAMPKLIPPFGVSSTVQISDHITSEHTPLFAKMPVPVAARSKVWVSGRSLAGIEGSNSTGSMYVCCEYCVLSDKGLCDWLIISSEEDPYRVWCACV